MFNSNTGNHAKSEFTLVQGLWTAFFQCMFPVHSNILKINSINLSGWIDEAAFQAADTNGDGVQNSEEFLVALTRLK
jgi:hypothetical protein